MPDIESLEHDVEEPHTIELVQATNEGQKKILYYSAKSWVKEDFKQADKIELMLFERGSKKRYFFTYIFKPILAGIGYFLSLRVARLAHKYECAMDDELRKDRDIIFNHWNKKYGAMPRYHAGFVHMIFLFFTIDNAYNTFYKEIKQQICETKAGKCKTSKTKKYS